MKLFAALLALVLTVTAMASGCGASVPEESPGRKGKDVRPAALQAGPAVSTPQAVESRSVASPAQADPGMANIAETAAVAAPGPARQMTAPAPGPITIATSYQAPFTVPVTFEVLAIAMRDTVRLRSEAISDAAGFACQSAGEGGNESMSVLRFAHYGHADSPFAMKWVLFLPNGEGTLTARPATGDQRGGYEVTLRGPLEFDMILRGATKPLRLGPRMVPEFTGYSRTWPPKGVVLTLANGPVPFFVLNGAAPPPAPMLTVLEARFTLGSHATNYLSQPPQIVGAQLVDTASRPWKKGVVGGMRLEWSSTADAVKPVSVTGYNVYRTSADGSWQRIASLPADQMSYVDRTFDGHSGTQYAVTHRSEYPTGFEYEGVFSAPVTVSRIQ